MDLTLLSNLFCFYSEEAMAYLLRYWQPFKVTSFFLKMIFYMGHHLNQLLFTFPLTCFTLYLIYCLALTPPQILLNVLNLKQLYFLIVHPPQHNFSYV